VIIHDHTFGGLDLDMTQYTMTPYNKQRPDRRNNHDKWKVWRNGVLIAQSDFVYPYDRSTMRVGYLFPKWKEAILAGRDATTYLSDQQWLRQVVNPAHDFSYKNGGYNYRQWQDWRGWELPYERSAISQEVADLVSAADNEARTRAYKRLGTHFEGVTALGELKETLEMLRKPAKGLRSGLDNYIDHARRVRSKVVKTPRRGRHRRYADAISDLWLEYSWGWKPLKSDIEDAFAAFRERMDAPALQRFSAFAKRDRLGYKHYRSGIAASYDNIYAHYWGIATAKYAGSARSLLTSDVDAMTSLGIYPAAFIPAAWNLCPWSWLVDYFTNVGDVLNCHAIATRVDFHHVRRTWRRKQVSRVQLAPAMAPWAGYDYAPSYRKVGNALVVHTTVDRSPVQGVPLPYLQTDIDFNLGRGLNIGALVTAMHLDQIFSPTTSRRK
jgi:hypothetical protein